MYSLLEMGTANTKRSYQKHPGVMQAARDLGCSYWHLRRVVNGERESKSLTKKFRAWQRTHRNGNRKKESARHPGEGNDSSGATRRRLTRFATGSGSGRATIQSTHPHVNP